MPEIMTTKELAKYLRLHEITICKYAAEGKIPAVRVTSSRGWEEKRTDGYSPKQIEDEFEK